LNFSCHPPLDDPYLVAMLLNLAGVFCLLQEHSQFRSHGAPGFGRQLPLLLKLSPRWGSNSSIRLAAVSNCSMSCFKSSINCSLVVAILHLEPGRGRTRDPPLNNLRLLLRGWRQQAVEAEVHGGGAIVVGPVVGEGDQSESPRCFAAAPDLNRIAQRGVRYFWHRSIAEIE